ncbi:MAG TPA: hypothetical protein VM686_03560 [Polyangiaceae bacterium]|nr:hypothetical protein [Polyangiaceae bacterium]
MAFVRSKGFIVPSFFALTLLLSASAYGQEAISEEAKGYFRNGVELLESQPPNYQDAYYQFKLAYEKSNSWKVLGNLGLCALKLERDGEAVQYYKEYLDRGGKEIGPEERTQLERDILLVNGNTATVKLTSAVPDIEIVAARAGSSAPPQTYKFQGTELELRLRGGTHTLTANAPDGKTQRWEVALSPGKEVAHTFDFVAPPEAAPGQPAPQPGATTPPPQPGSSGGGGSGLKTAGFVTAGVGGAALIAGVIVRFVVAPGKADDAKALCRGSVCPESAESDFDSANSMGTVGGVLMIGGGVLAAAGVGMIIAGSSSSSEQAALVEPKPKLRLVPAVGAKSAGLWATGSF